MESYRDCRPLKTLFNCANLTCVKVPTDLNKNSKSSGGKREEVTKSSMSTKLDQKSAKPSGSRKINKTNYNDNQASTLVVPCSTCSNRQTNQSLCLNSSSLGPNSSFLNATNEFINGYIAQNFHSNLADFDKEIEAFNELLIQRREECEQTNRRNIFDLSPIQKAKYKSVYVRQRIHKYCGIPDRDCVSELSVPLKHNDFPRPRALRSHSKSFPKVRKSFKQNPDQRKSICMFEDTIQEEIKARKMKKFKEQEERERKKACACSCSCSSKHKETINSSTIHYQYETEVFFESVSNLDAELLLEANQIKEAESSLKNREVKAFGKNSQGKKGVFPPKQIVMNQDDVLKKYFGEEIFKQTSKAGSGGTKSQNSQQNVKVDQKSRTQKVNEHRLSINRTSKADPSTKQVKVIIDRQNRDQNERKIETDRPDKQNSDNKLLNLFQEYLSDNSKEKLRKETKSGQFRAHQEFSKKVKNILREMPPSSSISIATEEAKQKYIADYLSQKDKEAADAARAKAKAAEQSKGKTKGYPNINDQDTSFFGKISSKAKTFLMGRKTEDFDDQFVSPSKTGTEGSRNSQYSFLWGGADQKKKYLKAKEECMTGVNAMSSKIKLFLQGSSKSCNFFCPPPDSKTFKQLFSPPDEASSSSWKTVSSPESSSKYSDLTKRPQVCSCKSTPAYETKHLQNCKHSKHKTDSSGAHMANKSFKYGKHIHRSSPTKKDEEAIKSKHLYSISDLERQAKQKLPDQTTNSSAYRYANDKERPSSKKPTSPIFSNSIINSPSSSVEMIPKSKLKQKKVTFKDTCLERKTLAIQETKKNILADTSPAYPSKGNEKAILQDRFEDQHQKREKPKEFTECTSSFAGTKLESREETSLETSFVKNNDDIMTKDSFTELLLEDNEDDENLDNSSDDASIITMRRNDKSSIKSLETKTVNKELEKLEKLVILEDCDLKEVKCENPNDNSNNQRDLKDSSPLERQKPQNHYQSSFPGFKSIINPMGSYDNKIKTSLPGFKTDLCSTINIESKIHPTLTVRDSLEDLHGQFSENKNTYPQDINHFSASFPRQIWNDSNEVFSAPVKISQETLRSLESPLQANNGDLSRRNIEKENAWHKFTNLTPTCSLQQMLNTPMDTLLGFSKPKPELKPKEEQPNGRTFVRANTKQLDYTKFPKDNVLGNSKMVQDPIRKFEPLSNKQEEPKESILEKETVGKHGKDNLSGGILRKLDSISNIKQEPKGTSLEKEPKNLHKVTLDDRIKTISEVSTKIELSSNNTKDFQGNNNESESTKPNTNRPSSGNMKVIWDVPLQTSMDSSKLKQDNTKTYDSILDSKRKRPRKTVRKLSSAEALQEYFLLIDYPLKGAASFDSGALPTLSSTTNCSQNSSGMTSSLYSRLTKYESLKHLLKFLPCNEQRLLDQLDIVEEKPFKDDNKTKYFIREVPKAATAFGGTSFKDTSIEITQIEDHVDDNLEPNKVMSSLNTSQNVINDKSKIKTSSNKASLIQPLSSILKTNKNECNETKNKTSGQLMTENEKETSKPLTSNDSNPKKDQPINKINVDISPCKVTDLASKQEIKKSESFAEEFFNTIFRRGKSSGAVDNVNVLEKPSTSEEPSKMSKKISNFIEEFMEQLFSISPTGSEIFESKSSSTKHVEISVGTIIAVNGKHLYHQSSKNKKASRTKLSMSCLDELNDDLYEEDKRDAIEALNDFIKSFPLTDKTQSTIHVVKRLREMPSSHYWKRRVRRYAKLKQRLATNSEKKLFSKPVTKQDVLDKASRIVPHIIEQIQRTDKRVILRALTHLARNEFEQQQVTVIDCFRILLRKILGSNYDIDSVLPPTKTMISSFNQTDNHILYKSSSGNLQEKPSINLICSETQTDQQFSYPLAPKTSQGAQTENKKLITTASQVDDDWFQKTKAKFFQTKYLFDSSNKSTQVDEPPKPHTISVGFQTEIVTLSHCSLHLPINKLNFPQVLCFKHIHDAIVKCPDSSCQVSVRLPRLGWHLAIEHYSSLKMSYIEMNQIAKFSFVASELAWDTRKILHLFMLKNNAQDIRCNFYKKYLPVAIIARPVSIADLGSQSLFSENGSSEFLMLWFVGPVLPSVKIDIQFSIIKDTTVVYNKILPLYSITRPQDLSNVYLSGKMALLSTEQLTEFSLSTHSLLINCEIVAL